MMNDQEFNELVGLAHGCQFSPNEVTRLKAELLAQQLQHISQMKSAIFLAEQTAKVQARTLNVQIALDNQQ